MDENTMQRRRSFDEPITSERGWEAVHRFIHRAFNNTTERMPQLCIPTQADDDDVVLGDFIRQLESKVATLTQQLADAQAKAALSAEMAAYLHGLTPENRGDEDADWLDRYDALSSHDTGTEVQQPPEGLTPEEQIAWAESLPNAANGAYTQEMTEAYTRAQFEEPKHD